MTASVPVAKPPPPPGPSNLGAPAPQTLIPNALTPDGTVNLPTVPLPDSPLAFIAGPGILDVELGDSSVAVTEVSDSVIVLVVNPAETQAETP